MWQIGRLSRPRKRVYRRLYAASTSTVATRHGRTSLYTFFFAACPLLPWVASAATPISGVLLPLGESCYTPGQRGYTLLRGTPEGPSDGFLPPALGSLSLTPTFTAVAALQKASVTLGLNREQLDLKNERGIGPDVSAGSARPIGRVRGNEELPLRPHRGWRIRRALLAMYATETTLG